MVFLLLVTGGELVMDTNITPDHSLVALLAQVPDFRRDDERTDHLLGYFNYCCLRRPLWS